jgi:hypothetical protein
MNSKSLVLVSGISLYGVSMVAYSVETTFLNSGFCMARRAARAKSRALL